MPPEHSDSNSTPPTVGLAQGTVEAARTYVAKENVITDEVENEIRKKADQLENALQEMTPVKGRNRISWYEASSKSVNQKYEELMGLLSELGITLEVEVPEDLSL